MALKDYAHWNEDAQMMWWQEEGRFAADEGPEYDPDDFLPGQDDDDEDDEEGPFNDSAERFEGGEDRYIDQIYEDRIVGDEW